MNPLHTLLAHLFGSQILRCCLGLGIDTAAPPAPTPAAPENAPAPKNQKTWFSIKALKSKDPQGAADAPTEAEIYIYDEIGGWGISTNEFINELKALGTNIDTIDLRINCPGGSIIAGNTIYNALQRHPARIVAHIDGLAASMASVVALAADEVHMAANALYMIHNPWTHTIGEADDLRKDADLLDKMKETILNAYSRSNLTREELTALMDAETWFTAQEAQDAGFIDNIEGAQLAAAEALHHPALKNYHLPAEYQAAVTQPLLAATAQSNDPADPFLVNLQNEYKAANEALTAQAQTIADLRAQLTTAGETLSTLKEEHAQALAQAREITETHISQKAAELLAAVGQPPAANAEDNPGQNASPAITTAEAFWQTYHSITDLTKRNAWYAENKHLLDDLH